VSAWQRSEEQYFDHVDIVCEHVTKHPIAGVLRAPSYKTLDFMPVPKSIPHGARAWSCRRSLRCLLRSL